MIKKKNRYTCIHIVFVTFVLILKFILISLLHVLYVLKIKGVFGMKNPTQKCAEKVFLSCANLHMLRSLK